MAGVIVVGVDGSASSKAALAWAVDEARLRGVAVQAVTVSEAGANVMYGDGTTAFAPDVLEESARAAKDEARRTLEASIAEVEAGGVEIEAVVEEGVGIAGALIERSQQADLLAVGSRGLGGFRGLLLGSVSQQCASHAHCPVVIVRAEHDE